MQETAKIWMNGELVDWADATVHVGVHGLHYGTGVFEGIRAYETPKGPAVFRLADHMQRLHDSAKLLYMDLPYSVEDLREATHELVRANGLPACYIRPIAFYGYGSARRAHAGQPGRDRDHELAVGRLPRRGRRSSKGITAKISSWKRVGPNVDPARRRRRPASTSTRCSRRPRRSAAATTRASSSPTTASSPTGRARTSSSSRTAAS